MHLTPMDINSHEFARKNIGGLDDVEVYSFIKKIGREYENLYAENKELRDNNQRLTSQMQDYLELEKTLKQTLISAQKTSGDMKDNAEKEAELIVKQAELQAERILDEARTESEAIGKEIRELKHLRRSLKMDLRSVLESYQAMINEESPLLTSLPNPMSKVA